MNKSDRERHTDASTCKMMPAGFEPGSYEVLIGRGRRCTMHWGNQRFRAMINAELEAYTAAADCKRQKSSIIGRVLADVQHHSPHAGFVKKDVGTGRWLSLTDAASRVSIAQAFRDSASSKGLNGSYRSSKTSKQIKRKHAKTKQTSETPPRLPKEETAVTEGAHLVLDNSNHGKISLSFGDTTEQQDDHMMMMMDPFSVAAANVAVIEEEDVSFNCEVMSNAEFGALLDAFAQDVNTEDNPFEPIPISVDSSSEEDVPFSFDALPLSQVLSPIRSPARKRMKLDSNPFLQKVRYGIPTFKMPDAVPSACFESTLPARDVRAAMTA